MISAYSDHAANERTSLAWVRTGIAVVAFGFVIEKFNLFLITIADAAGGDVVHRAKLERLSGPLGRFEGLAFMFIGLVLVVLATTRFIRVARLLDDSEMHSARNVRAELILSGVLGRVDGFDQDKAESKRDERAVILRRLLTSKCDTLEALELSDRLFDSCPRLVECFREEGGHIFGVRSIRNCWTYSTLARGVAVRFGIVAFVTERGARIDIGADVEKRLEVAAVAGLTTSEMKANWQAAEIGFQVNLGREAATRAAERLIMLPPFAPAAET